MSLPARILDHSPTRADLDALPPHIKGEIIDGVLYATSRPRGMHQWVEAQVLLDAANPYQRGRGGPGGWWILPEPGIELPNAPEVAPDLAGWRRERLPELPRDASITVVPDWVCEVLSTSTRRYDLQIKRPFYARVGVSYLWIVDPDAMLVTASALENGRWSELGVWSEERDACIPPFDAAPMDVGAWWSAAPAGDR